MFCGKRLNEGEVCNCQSSDINRRKIFQKELKPNFKLFTKISLLAVILCFFMPALMVSCDGEKFTMSTFSLMTGSELNQMYSYMSSGFSGVQVLAFFVMALGVTALVLLFVNLKEKLLMLPVFFSAGGFLTSLILFIGIQARLSKASIVSDFVEIEYRLEPGAYLVILLYLISTVLCYLSIKSPAHCTGHEMTADTSKLAPDDYVPSVPKVSKTHVFSERELESLKKEPVSGLKSTMRNRDADGERTAQASEDTGKKYYRAPDDFD